VIRLAVGVNRLLADGVNRLLFNPLGLRILLFFRPVSAVRTYPVLDVICAD